MWETAGDCRKQKEKSSWSVLTWPRLTRQQCKKTLPKTRKSANGESDTIVKSPLFRHDCPTCQVLWCPLNFIWYWKNSVFQCLLFLIFLYSHVLPHTPLQSLLHYFGSLSSSLWATLVSPYKHSRVCCFALILSAGRLISLCHTEVHYSAVPNTSVFP